jgi:hypothetical protein
VIYLDDRMAGRLAAMRGPGESFSEVILRLTQAEASKRGSTFR